jgi:transposase
MLTLPRSVKVWVAAEPVHMGKQHDGLVALITNAFGDTPFSGNLYVFISRRGDRAKVLWWERGGFVIYYKRLERGRFKLPTFPPNQSRMALDGAQLAMLLDGIDLGRVIRPKAWAPEGIDTTVQM